MPSCSRSNAAAPPGDDRALNGRQSLSLILALRRYRSPAVTPTPRLSDGLLRRALPDGRPAQSRAATGGWLHLVLVGDMSEKRVEPSITATSFSCPQCG